MTRPAADVINAILKNLKWARDAAESKSDHASNETLHLCYAAESSAYSQAIALIRTEAASLLEAQP